MKDLILGKYFSHNAINGGNLGGRWFLNDEDFLYSFFKWLKYQKLVTVDLARRSSKEALLSPTVCGAGVPCSRSMAYRWLKKRWNLPPDQATAQVAIAWGIEVWLTLNGYAHWTEVVLWVPVKRIFRLMDKCACFTCYSVSPVGEFHNIGCGCLPKGGIILSRMWSKGNDNPRFNPGFSQKNINSTETLSATLGKTIEIITCLPWSLAASSPGGEQHHASPFWSAPRVLPTPGC